MIAYTEGEDLALRVENLSVFFGKRAAVFDVSFDLPVGSVLVILGSNGAGKSTILRAMNRTVSISAGKIWIYGRDNATLSRRQLASTVAVVAQENETKFPISVFQYVIAGRFAHVAGFGPDSDPDVLAVNDAIARCNLQGFESRWMNELSGGERQRAVLARALATEARLLLLDEPSANLDPGNQAKIFRLVRARTKECGGSAVIVTHDLNLAAHFADLILLMDGGRLLDFGAPAKVLTSNNLRQAFGIDMRIEFCGSDERPRIEIVY